jgi:AcrR family transcriptional regulator
MPRPKLVSDEQLMKAARRVFLKDGFKAPVAAVAKELGVTPAALFHRVKSKERLFLQALYPKDPPELQALEGRPAEGGRVQEQLIEILSGLTEYLSHAMPAMFHLHSGGLPVGRKKYKKPPNVMLRLHIGLAKWLRYAASRGTIRIKNPVIAAEALLGALEARYLRGYLLGETFTPAENRAFVSDLVAEIIR